MTSLEGTECSGQQSASKLDGKCGLSEETCPKVRRTTDCEVADVLGMSLGSVHSILKDDLNLRRIATQFVPTPAPSAVSVYKFLATDKMTHYTPLSSQQSVLCYFTFSQKMALKGRRFSDINVIEAKLQDTLAKFKALPFIKCFEWQCDRRFDCLKSPGSCVAMDSTDWRKCCYGQH